MIHIQRNVYFSHFYYFYTLSLPMYSAVLESLTYRAMLRRARLCHSMSSVRHSVCPSV